MMITITIMIIIIIITTTTAKLMGYTYNAHMKYIVILCDAAAAAPGGPPPAIILIGRACIRRRDRACSGRRCTRGRFQFIICLGSCRGSYDIYYIIIIYTTFYMRRRRNVLYIIMRAHQTGPGFSPSGLNYRVAM